MAAYVLDIMDEERRLWGDPPEEIEFRQAGEEILAKPSNGAVLRTFSGGIGSESPQEWVDLQARVEQVGDWIVQRCPSCGEDWEVRRVSSC